MFKLNGTLPWYMQLFAFGFGAILFGLSVSKVVVSIGLFIMAFSWIVSGDYKQKILKGFSSNVTISFSIIFLIHLTGLIYTDNYSYALKDIKIKLPLFLLPFMVAGMPSLNKTWQKFILYLFWIGLTVSSIGTLYLYLGFGNKNIIDSRNLSPFVSHIRFSIMLVFGLLSVAYLYYKERNNYYILLLILFSVTLFLIKSGTGWGLLMLALVVIAIVIQFKYRLVVISGVFLLIVSGVIFMKMFYNKHFILSPEFKLYKNTLNGKPYIHYSESDIENGFYVWKNINEEELSRCWNKVSDININQKDLNDQPIRNTLVRYLTSKHLTKDSTGISKLTSQDIYNIRDGFTNYLYINQKSFSYKLYQTLYELHMFFTQQYANNHSLTMRLLFVQTGLKIWSNNFWFGVGTGDVQDAFNWQYEFDQVRLDPENRLRAHNQFITFGLSFGIIGFLIIIVTLMSVFKIAGKIGTVTLIILFASFLNEDTLETQIGVTMFCAIICYVFLIINKENQEEKIGKHSTL